MEEMRRLRVLLITQYFWPENFRINELAQEFCLCNVDLTILTGYPNYPDGNIFPSYKDNPNKFLKFYGSQVIRVPMLPRGQNKTRLLLNYLSFLVMGSIVGPWLLRGRGFDAILIYQPSPITVGFVGLVMRRLKKAPIIFWTLDLWPDTLISLGIIKSKLAIAIVTFVSNYVYRGADIILAQSKSFVSQLSKIPGLENKVTYFPGWAEDIFQSSFTGAAEELSWEPNKFTIIFAGNIGEAQDFPAILQAIEELGCNQWVRWVILGGGRKANWVKGRIAEMIDHSCVHVLGAFSLERMPSFFMHADALLVTLQDQPIFAQTIPAKLQTYLAAGKPILGMLNGEGAKVIRESRAGFISRAGDYRGLVKNIKTMALLSKEEREVMGLNGKKYSEEFFNKKILISALLKNLDKAANGYKN